MRYRAALVFLALLLPAAARGAGDSVIDVTVLGSYRLAGTWGVIQTGGTGQEKSIQVGSGMSYGLMVDTAVGERWWIGLSFDTSRTPLQIKSDASENEESFGDLQASYAHFNMTYTYPKGKWEPYLMGGLGITLLNPVEEDTSGKLRGSWQFAGGGRYMFSERFGVRLQARVRSTYTPDATELFCNLGACGQPVSANWMWQGDGLLGAVIRF